MLFIAEPYFSDMATLRGLCPCLKKSIDEGTYCDIGK